MPQALRQERITQDGLHATVHASGCGRLEGAVAVVLKTDGSLNVVTQPAQGPWTALEPVP